MTSIESLIQQKLFVALIETKRQVAERLFEVVQPMAPAAKTPEVSVPEVADPAKLADKKKAKLDQIAALRQKITGLQIKTSTAKDPTAMRQQLQAQQDKLSNMQRELTAIK